MELHRQPVSNIPVFEEISLESNRHQLVSIPDSGRNPLERLISAQEILLLQRRLEYDPRMTHGALFDKNAQFDRSFIWMQKAGPAVTGLRENGVVTYAQLHDRLHSLAPTHGVDGEMLNEDFVDLLKGKFFKDAAKQNCYENTGQVTQLFRLTCTVADVTVEQALAKPATHKIAPRPNPSAIFFEQP